MEKKAKKKLTKGRIILYILLAVILFIAIQTPITIAISNGKFAAGNKDQYTVANTPALADSPLRGKTIIFLGRSVTYGSASGGESFADYMAKRDGIVAVKEAVSGTTLVDETVWGSERAVRARIYSGGDYQYLLLYNDRLIQVELPFEPSDDQAKVIAQKLMSLGE